MATKSSQQRVALITGGTGGIGRAIAAAFSDGDYEIVVTGFAADECERIHSDRPDWRVRQLDVQDSAEVTTVVDDLPQLDVLVNAAGMILRDGKEHEDRKSTRLNSSHVVNSYAVLCLNTKSNISHLSRDPLPLSSLPSRHPP